MTILGIDPGTARLGFGILGKEVICGVIETPKGQAAEKRLLTIYENLNAIIKKHKPDYMAVEQLFFNKNVTTAISVGEARGVVLLLAAKYDIPVKSYTPLQVKQGITSYGRATKQDVQFMVKTILELDEIPKPDDAADALAIALTHKYFLENRRLLNIDSDLF